MQPQQPGGGALPATSMRPPAPSLSSGSSATLHASPLGLPAALQQLQQASTPSSLTPQTSSTSAHPVVATPTPPPFVSSSPSPHTPSSSASGVATYSTSQPQTPTVPGAAYRATGVPAPPLSGNLQQYMASLAGGGTGSASASVPSGAATAAVAPSTASAAAAEPAELISKHKLRELLRHSSPHERMEPEVEEVLLELGDDFLENLIAAGSLLAKHRGSDTLEVRDVALHMERTWDMRLPGYSHHLESLDMRGKRQGLSEIHKKRIALIRKTHELNDKEKKKGSTKRKRKEGEAP